MRGLTAQIGKLLLVAIAFAAAIAFVVAAPVALVDTAAELAPAERVKADSDARVLALQLLGGVFLLGGLYYSARTYATTREGRITEAYDSAVGQVGGDKLEVRLGGIYALERIARVSRRDRGTIAEVLAAFVRTRATSTITPLETDIDAALVVLGRLPRPLGVVGRIDLRGARLPGVRLEGANLESADLRDAMLDGADLRGAKLSGALFDGAQLKNADAAGADLRRASFASGAHLEAARFGGARLQEARFDGAQAQRDAAFIDPARRPRSGPL